MAASSQLPKRTTRGFTLVELAVVIAIVAILAAVAAPAMSRFIQAQRLRNAAFDMVSDLLVARSEALNRHSVIRVTPRTIKSDGWSDGWDINIGSTAGEVVASRTGLDPALRFSVKDSSAASLSSLSIGMDGRVVGSTPVRITVTYTDPMPSGVTPSCVTIDATGRPRSDKGAC